MTTEQRGRGRPKGSGKKDGPTLDRVADLIVKDPPLKPTTAMLRIIRNCAPSQECVAAIPGTSPTVLENFATLRDRTQNAPPRAVPTGLPLLPCSVTKT
jgi:hypothetical protein